MNRRPAAAQLAVHLPGTLGALHRDGELGREVSIQAARFDVRLHVGRDSEDEGAIGSFPRRTGLIGKTRQFQPHVAVDGVRVDAPAGLEDFDIAVYGVQVFYRVYAGDAQRAVHGADMLDARAVRNVDGVINGNFNAFVLRVAGGDGNRVRLGVHFDGNTL